MTRKRTSLVLSTALGLGLAASPFAFDGFSALDGPAALANGNGGGNGAGHGNAGGNGHGNAGGNGGGAAAHGGGHAGGAASHGDDDGDPAADDLGRLNGFVHASDKGRTNAARGSAVGEVSHQYAEALQAYLDSGDAVDPLLPRDPLLLAQAGAILGDAANKPLSPEIVALINDELGLELTAAEIDALLEAAEAD
jgi:hypothetical protein